MYKFNLVLIKNKVFNFFKNRNLRKQKLKDIRYPFLDGGNDNNEGRWNSS